MTSFEISQKQKNEFESKGFLVLKNAIPVQLLTKWRNLLDEFNHSALDSYQKKITPPNTCFIENGNTPLLSRINDLLSIYPDALLELMASPAVMAIARDLCGPNAIPLQCDAVFKHNHPTSAVLWHQDVVHSRTFPYLNIGIYLDDSELDDGCLSGVVGSQYETIEICPLVQKHGWKIPNAVDIPAKAGDIIIHDMMLLHGSKIKQNSDVRRTVYIEMRPSAAPLAEKVHSKEWVELRRRWMGIIARRSEEIWPEQSHGELPKDLRSDQEEIRAIFSLRESPQPSNCCFETVNALGYPC